DLQHMVLHDVPQGTSLVIKPTTILDAEILGHRDLDATDMVTIPQRFEHRVGKAGIDDVLYWLLTQVVVDAEDVLLGEILRQQPTERSRRRPVVTERLLDHQPRTLGTARLGQ